MSRQLTIYGGYRKGRDGVVTRNGELLPIFPLPGVQTSCPDGKYHWGYGGAGPNQLAKAMLLDYTGDPSIVDSHFQEFKHEVVAKFPKWDSWEYTGDEMLQWLLDAARKVASPGFPGRE